MSESKNNDMVAKDVISNTSTSPLPSKDDKMEEERYRFLKDLPPNTSIHKYSGTQEMEKVMSQEYERFMVENKSPFVVFTNISSSDIDYIENTRQGIIDYHTILQTLIVKMASLPHEMAAEYFGYLIQKKAEGMGVRRLIAFRSSTRSQTPERKKQPDRSWGPRQRVPGRSIVWPTVALEVGFSESQAQLKRDMVFWLHESQGQVIMGISIDIKRPSGNIYINSWDRGVMPTRQHPSPEPKMLSEIQIKRGQNGQPPHITGNRFIIPFQTILLRPANQELGEGDFIISKQELLELARDIWDSMDMLRV